LSFIPALALLFIPQPGNGLRAELLPSQGTFKGIYHRDRAGVGRFSFFFVHRSLLQSFDKHEGEYIKVEVRKAVQPMNPGPSVIHEVGEIKRLPAPPLSITVQVLPAGIRTNSAVQVLARVRNTGQNTVRIMPSSMTVGIARTVPAAAARMDFLHSGYAAGQFMNSRKRQLRSLVLSVPWRRHHIIGSPADVVPRTILSPGESLPFVLALDNGLDPGDYEAEAMLHVAVKDQQVPVAAWHAFSTPLGEASGPGERLALTMSTARVVDQWWRFYDKGFRTRHRWYVSNLVLSNATDTVRALPECRHSGGGKLWLGRLLGWSRENNPVPLTFDYPRNSSMGPPGTPCRMATFRQGNTARSEIRFRTMSFFPERPLARITCRLLTDRGLETFTVSDSFADRLFVPPPDFGPGTRGVKCRVRTDSATYQQGQGVLLFWQIVNAKQDPVVLGNKSGWTVLLDGMPASNIRHHRTGWGWATMRGPFTHQESFIELDSQHLPPGKHTVRIQCTGHGGRYKNANGESIPVLHGTLQSNPWTFTVEKKN